MKLSSTARSTSMPLWTRVAKRDGRLVGLRPMRETAEVSSNTEAQGGGDDITVHGGEGPATATH